MLTLKDLKKNVEALGINFERWRKDEADKALIKLIRNEKAKDFYSKWELQQLNQALYQLLIDKNVSKESNKESKQPQYQSHQQEPQQKNKNHQTHQKVEK